MNGRVYIGGQIVAPAEASISIFDRGFLYGDSVYEVVRIYDGVPFCLYAHLRRLFASGDLIGFAIPFDEQVVRTAISQTIDAAGLSEAYLRVVVTRGSGPVGLDPNLAVDPQLVVVVLELPDLPAAIYEQGRSAQLVSIRRNLKRAIDPQAKTGNYMNNVLAVGEARARGADEAIMLDHQGRVAEGSSANVFALIDGVWCTPPLEVGILGGITRQTLLQVCEDEGVAAHERILWPADLERAIELFVCSSIRELIPIVTLNGRPVASGKVGAETRRLHALYRQSVRGSH